MADPMTPERLAEIRDRELSASEGPWLFKGTEQQDDLSLRLTIGEAPGGEEIARIEVSAEAAGWSFHRMGAQADAEFIAHARSDVPALLAEVERLRAELDAIRTTETDVTWLADGVRRLILGVSVRTAKDASAAQYTIAQEVASHINAGILTAFVSSRIVDLSVEHIKKAEAERDRLARQVKRVRDRHPRKTDDADCMDADTTLGCQHGPGYHVVEYCGTCDEEWPCAEIRALGGTEADR